jgi:hypothetical protein
MVETRLVRSHFTHIFLGSTAGGVAGLFAAMSSPPLGFQRVNIGKIHTIKQ